jgi:hypothetical protein
MAKKYLALALAGLAACQSAPSHPEAAAASPAATPSADHEPYRPQFHFSPKENWMNDPNGLVYEHGTYHLFFLAKPHRAGGGQHPVGARHQHRFGALAAAGHRPGPR